MTPGTRVALTASVALWPEGTRGTIVRAGESGWDWMVMPDCADEAVFGFKASELRAIGPAP